MAAFVLLQGCGVQGVERGQGEMEAAAGSFTGLHSLLGYGFAIKVHTELSLSLLCACVWSLALLQFLLLLLLLLQLYFQ